METWECRKVNTNKPKKIKFPKTQRKVYYKVVEVIEDPCDYDVIIISDC